MATRSCCSTPRTAVAGARSATSAQAPCRSTRRSRAPATIHISWNCARPTVEPLQRIDAKQECRSLETTVSCIDLGFSYQPLEREAAIFRHLTYFFALFQLCPDLLGPQTGIHPGDEQMVQYIGALSHEPIPVSRDGFDQALDEFLAQLLHHLRRALGQQAR